MIKTQELVPEIYYNRSRDFQLLGRIYDLALNYINNNVNLIENNPICENFDTKFIDLVAYTVGFQESRHYNVTQLKAICSIFLLAVRNKGSITGINQILNTLTNIEDINDEAYAEISVDDPYELDIFLPEKIKDSSLLEDVLSYIVPAGITINLIKQVAIKSAAATKLSVSDDSIKINSIEGRDVIMATVADYDETLPTHTNSIDDEFVGYGKVDNTTVIRQEVSDYDQSLEDLAALKAKILKEEEN